MAKKIPNEFESGSSKIVTIMYHDFTIYFKNMWRQYFYNNKTNKRYVCSIIQKTIYTAEEFFNSIVSQVT